MTLPQGSQQQSQHFLLKWNNHRSNMVNVFESLLASDHLVDVTIAVEGKFLKAHKIVLSACSPYFQAMFVNHSPSDRYPILVFHDIQYAHLKTLLDFMYRGEISIDEKDLGDVLKVAEALSIRGLSSFESDEDEADSKPDSQGTNASQSENAASEGKGEERANGSAAVGSADSSGNASGTKSGHKQKGTKSKNKGANGVSENGSASFSIKEENKTNSSVCDASTMAKIPPSLGSPKRLKKSPTPKLGDNSTQPEGDAPPVKKKRGRSKAIPIASSGAASLPSSSNAKSPSPNRSSSLGAISSPGQKNPQIPRVRRRVPRRYPGIPNRLKRLKLLKQEESGDPDCDNNSSKTGNNYDDIDEALLQQILEGEDCEPLSEMSVRGLDLFKYASVEDNVYRCMECEKLRIPKTFKNKYSFQRHAFLYHEGNMRKVFPCPVCSREFSRPDKMKNHMKSVHEGAGSKEGSGSGPSGNDASSDQMVIDQQEEQEMAENESSCDL